MTASSADLSLSCLLDDLLAEQGGEASGAASPKQRNRGMGAIHENAPPHDGELSPEEEAALLAEQEDQARQLAELCGEMDSALASLGDWELRHEKGIEALKKQLEAQYGFSYEEALATAPPPSSSASLSLQALLSPSVEASDDVESDGPDMCAQLIDEGPKIGEAARALQDAEKVRAKASRPPMKLATSGGHTESTRLPQPANGSVEQLLEDEARLSALRAEVEMLRQKELAAARACAPGENTPLTEGALDELGIDGLSQWVTDVDAVLGQCDLDINPVDAAELATLDARLVDAHKHAHLMQHAMDDVKARLDDELNDLDAMMAECNAMQAKMGVNSA
eukprot:TRINITY_DN20185_c0_g1_i1.p1 TRINITY_DN20185_c0_g1~~TRINITY_DN20185_c0_g1_i1.p1  ORF type:complete len:338 (-),score=120.24 TRINITY_DN20185_c0_g1_i1:169-1182(-)